MFANALSYPNMSMLQAVSWLRQCMNIMGCSGLVCRGGMWALQGEWSVILTHPFPCSYLAEQCWNGGFVYLIMLRRIKRKAPLPPSNGNNSNSCDPKAKPSPEPGDRAAQNGKRTRKFGVITRTPGSKDSKEKLGSEQGNGHCTPMEVEVAQPEASEAESNGEEQPQGTGALYRGRLSDAGMPDIGDQAAQVCWLWFFWRRKQVCKQIKLVSQAVLCFQCSDLGLRLSVTMQAVRALSWE